MKGKLVACRACKDNVFEKDMFCPHCFKIWPADSMPMWKKRLYAYSILLVGMFLAVMVSAAISASHIVTKKHSNPPANDSAYQARMLCEDAIRMSVNNPSTLKMHAFAGYGQNIDETGTRRIVQSFSAKNAFGLETTHEALCSVTPQGKFSFQIIEAGR